MGEAHILVKLRQTDATFQRVLVREGEYYHPQLFRWCELPREWEEKVREALAGAKAGA